MTSNEPFDFFADRRNVEMLAAKLRRIGLDTVSVKSDRISCSCAWLDNPVDFVWVRSWWPDGETREDSAISIVHCGRTVASCDVSKLLRQKHPTSLATVIIDQLVTACAALTGKPHA